MHLKLQNDALYTDGINARYQSEAEKAVLCTKCNHNMETLPRFASHPTRAKLVPGPLGGREKTLFNVS